MESMKSGGGERSLLSLLQLIDYDSYDVDLMLFNPSGLFFGMIPEQVNIISLGKNYESFTLPLVQSVKTFLFKFKPGAAIRRVMYSRAVNGSNLPELERDRRSWKYLLPVFEKPVAGYDAAISYLEGKPNFFVADCVDAKVKIGYIHNDYSKLGLDASGDKILFGKFDRIVTVSDECKKVLEKTFPEFAEKFCVIENITSPKTLEKMAAEIPEEFAEKNGKKIILTVGRISQQKGYDIAIDAAEILDKKGYDFKWFSIGKGELQEEFEKKISEKNLNGKFVFLGERANPYPYLSGCDIYAQTSYYEGKSIAVDEAKILAKPIVATKFSTVYDQLEDGETALLAEMDTESVAEKIAQLFDDENLAKTLSENLKKIKLGNEEEIEKFYALLGEK